MMGTYKILAIADIHMSNRLPFAKPTKNGLTDRLEHQMSMFKEFAETAKKEKVDAVYILGDLFDRSLVDAITLTYTVKAVMKLKKICKVYILPGNHDANSIRGGRFVVEAFGKMGHKSVRLFDKPKTVKLSKNKNLVLWPSAFKPVGEVQKELKKYRKEIDKNDFNVLMIHNSIIGAKHLGWECDNGVGSDEVCKGFYQVLAGHFHEFQHFGKDNKGMYLGAPMHHDYGDVDRTSSYWTMEYSVDGVEMKRHTTSTPKFHVYDSLDDEVLIGEVTKGDYVRFEISCTNAEWSAKKPLAVERSVLLNDKGINCDFKHKPIYQHESRLKNKKSKSNEALSLNDAIDLYVDTVGATDGLSSKKLKRIGAEALEAVKVQYETA